MRSIEAYDKEKQNDDRRKPLVRIECWVNPDGTWSCKRERDGSGETAKGLATIEEVCAYLRAHGS